MSEFIRKYNDNIKHCGLCSTGTSRMETAKRSTHGQAKYNDNGLIYKCSALVHYTRVAHEHN